MSIQHSLQLKDQSDEELAARYYSGAEMPVLGELYTRYVDMVYAVCYKYLEDREAAKDAAMSIFEELQVTLRKHQISYFKAWLHRVAKNYCLMQLRAAKKLPTAPFDPERVYLSEEMHLDGAKEKEMQLDKMGKCLETLPGDQQKAIEMFYLKNMSYQEISSAANIELNKVRSQIQNGRRNLKICMEAGASRQLKSTE